MGSPFVGLSSGMLLVLRLKLLYNTRIDFNMVNSFYIRRQVSGISTQFRNSSIIDEPITPFVDKKGESVKPSPLFFESA
jgi:hypothetical protein